MIWRIIFIYFPCSIALYHFLTKKYINPYKLTMIFGKKGSGKTTLLVKMAYQYLIRGWTVYSTEPIPGIIHVSYEDIGKFQMERNSILLVDEVGMIWDNRKFKSFPDYLRDWFKLQRHYGVKVVLFSQSFDVDKKIRDLTDDLYLVTCVGRVFSYAKRIRRKIVLTAPTSEAPSKIADQLVFDSLLFALFGSRRFTFIPKWSKYFSSFAAADLPEKPWQITAGDIPPWVTRKLRKASKPQRLPKNYFVALDTQRIRGFPPHKIAIWYRWRSVLRLLSCSVELHPTPCTALCQLIMPPGRLRRRWNFACNRASAMA